MPKPEHTHLRIDEPSPVPGARNAEAPSVAALDRPSQHRTYGYSFRADGVLFEFELTEETNLVSDGRTGIRTRFRPKAEFRAGVAVDVRNWLPQAMRPQQRSPRRFQLLIPYKQFTAPVHAFKFVIDEYLWVEPPPFASNVAPAGVGPETKNLILSLRGCALDDAGWLRGVS